MYEKIERSFRRWEKSSVKVGKYFVRTAERAQCKNEIPLTWRNGGRGVGGKD